MGAVVVGGSRAAAGPLARRTLLGAVVTVAVVGGFVATDTAASAAAVAQAGPELARLMRGMAAIKALMAAVAVAGVWWRLAVPAPWWRLGAYAVVVAAMSASPGLIWGMVDIRLGAALLHGGLAATVIVLWRDPAVTARLEGSVLGRRMRRAT